MIDVLLIAALMGIAAAGAVLFARRKKKGDSCCSVSESPAKRILPTDRNKANYAFVAKANVAAMTCTGCARRIENAFNALPDTYAIVNYSRQTVDIYTKYEPTESELKRIAAQAGYSLSQIRIG